MDRITQAFQAVKREDFLPEETQKFSELDMPLRIGHGQTNSQPSTVRLMFEWLNPQPGEKILDVGSGSGWTTALLAYITGQSGNVYAVEKIPELVEFGSNNCKRAGIHNVEFFVAGREIGLKKFAPFDRILVSAEAGSLPGPLVGQLAINGRLVIPITGSIHVITKQSQDAIIDEEFPGFAFVPLL